MTRKDPGYANEQHNGYAGMFIVITVVFALVYWLIHLDRMSRKDQREMKINACAEIEAKYSTTMNACVKDHQIIYRF